MKIDKYLVYIQEKEQEEGKLKTLLKKIEGDKRLEGDYTDFDNVIVKMMKGGLIGLPMPFPGAVALFSIFYLVYNKFTDTCIKECGTYNIKGVCYNECYLKATEKVIDIIKKDLKNINKIKDRFEKNAAKLKLEKELRKWNSRANKYKKNIERAKKIEGFANKIRHKLPGKHRK